MANREESSAVEFELTDTESKVHSLEFYRGDWLLLIFHRHLG